MNPKTRKLWQLTALLAVDLIILILISSVCAKAETLGSKGERVAAIQHELRKLNLYSGNENGIFDFETRRALAEFRNITGIEKSNETDYETLCALGLDAKASVCFSAEAELLARCLTISGCKNYSEMLNEADRILKCTSTAITLGRFVSVNYPYFMIVNATPPDEAYSAAVQAIRKSAKV